MKPRELRSYSVLCFLVAMAASLHLLSTLPATHPWPPLKGISIGAILVTAGGVLLARAAIIEERRYAPIQRVPGGVLRRWADLWFSKKLYARVFEPILSDLEVEYFEALAEGDRVKARFVLVRGYGAFWMAFVAQLPVSLAKVVVELWLASKTG